MARSMCRGSRLLLILFSWKSFGGAVVAAAAAPALDGSEPALFFLENNEESPNFFGVSDDFDGRGWGVASGTVSELFGSGLDDDFLKLHDQLDFRCGSIRGGSGSG